MKISDFRRVIRLSIASVFSIISMTIALAQTEICNNGIDDDGDGFIDCYDSKCSNSPFCAGGFLNNNVLCQAKPAAFPKFTMKLKWQSPNQTTNHLNRASVGDLDRDGIPEVVVNEIVGNNIYILNGANGSIKKSLHVGYQLDRDPLIGNIDNSNCGWVFVSGGNYVYAYDCNLNFKWQSTLLSASPTLMGLADFDGDGKAEIYVRDEILAAESGIRIVKGTNSNNASQAPVAVDILDALGNVAGPGDNKLELVSGCNIFSVNLGTRTLNSGSLTLQKKAATYFYWQKNGNTSQTSIADYNQDGFLDVVASGSTGSQSANATVFFWDVKNNVVKTYIDANPAPVHIAGCSNTTGTYYANGWQNGIGRINIADIDGNGKLNASYISGKYMYALDENFNKLWRITVNEETSGYTGCTVYDFNGDGAAEVVYRDEQYLYIINGSDGSVNTQQQCIARTNFEYPVVADLDNDGQTELCVTCGFNDALAWSNFCNINYSQNACVRVFSSASVPWVPSRKLWNQHAYFNVNVNDDLTIPKVMQKQLAIFSSGVCTIGANRALNSFLNQSPYLDSKGCPTYAAPDLINVKSLFSVQQPVCPSNNFTVSMGVTNIGDATINGNVPVTFYNGDPTKAGATKLNTVTIPVNLTKGQTQTYTGLTVTGTGGAFTLYISLNDAGTSLPTPIVLPNTPFVECDYNNVISAAVTPSPVHLTATKVNDDVKCIGAAVPDNGAAQAYVLVGGVQDIVDYNFNWYNGAVSGAPNYTGAAYTGLGPGTYKVVAINIATGCSSDTASVTIAQINKAPLAVAIVVDQPNSSCLTPNGKVHAVVNGGDPIINYTFAWFEGNDIFTSPQIGTGDVATNLIGGKTYTVLVTDISSGCQVVASLAVPDVTSAPTVVATSVNPVCVPANSGSASATVGGVTAGFTFNWYIGAATKPSPDFTGSTYNALVAGSYTVVAVDNTSGCSSAPVTVTLTTPPPFTATATMVSQQTSCDPAAPNGAVTASVGGVTAGYTFNWFSGGTTAPANAIAGPNNLAAGVYTVLATNTSNGCTDTESVTVTPNLIFPVVTLTPAPNSICNPALASSPYSGSVVASVSYNGVPDPVGANYQFVWHQGSLITDPVIGGATTATITQLNGGNYTLVVTRVGSACAAPPATATVTNTTILPTLTTSQTPSTNCVPALQNGIAQVTQVNGIAVGSTANFTYQWYTGIGTASPIAGATSAQLANIQGGVGSNYTALVTDITSGCQNTATVLVGDAKVLPVLSLTEVDNGICNPALTSPAVSFTGSVTAAVTNLVGGLGSYSFAFGGGNTAPPTAVQTGNVYSNLNGGATAYTVVATQVPTGCASSIYNIVVNNTSTLPVITTSMVPSTTCAGTPNGSASVTSVDGSGTGAPYAFSWYDGNAVAGPVKSTTNLYANVQGGAGKDYTVQVTNQSNGCQNTSTVLVANKSVLPVLGPLSKTDNTFCVGTNGTATIGTLTFPAGTPVSAPYAGFTFAWNNGATTPSISGLAAGTYSLKATNTATSCTSASVKIKILNASVLPTITAATTPSTNCSGPGNGSVNVTGVVPVDTYTYQWFAGSSVGAPGSELNSPLTNPIASNLQGGAGKNFTVQVTLGSSGCANTKTVSLSDNSALPVITLSKTDNTNCSPTKNGAASLASLTDVNGGGVVNPPFTGYSFSWNPGGFTTSSINTLSSGSYTLTVTNTTLNCTSSPATVNVIDNLTNPVIAVTVTDQTSCNVATPNGRLAATGDGVADAMHTFVWYDGTGTGGAVHGQSSTGVISSLVSASYTVQVTTNATGCSSTQTDFVPDNLVIPTLSFTNVNPVTSCNAPNGSAQASIAGLSAPTGYDIYYDFTSTASGLAYPTDPLVIKAAGDGNNATNLNASPAPGYAGMIPGYLSAVVVDRNTQCQSIPVTQQIIDATSQNNITVTGTPAAGFCGLNGGGITISVAGGVPPHNFSWYNATPNNNNINFFNNPPNFGAAVPIATTQNLGMPGTPPGVSAGEYTVVVTDANGCGAFVSSNVPFAGSPTITITPTDVTKCVAPFDGAVKADVTGASAFGYLIEIFTGNSPILVNKINTSGPPADVVTLTSSSLASGDYYVQVTDEDPVNKPCPLGNQLTLKQIALPPIITVNQVNPNTSCSPTTFGDGSIKLTVNKDASDTTVPNYDITNIDKPTHPTYAPFPVNIGASGSSKTLTGFEPQTYTITITDNVSLCTANAVVTVPDQPDVPAITVAPTPETLCSTSNGSALASAVGLEPIAEIDFTWAKNNDLSSPVYSATGNGGIGGELINQSKVIPANWPMGVGGLGSGDRTFYVQGVKNGTAATGVGCKTAITQVVIPDQHVAPSLAFGAVPNSSCDNNFDGKITVAATETGPGMGMNYNFVWTTVPAPSSVANALNIASPYSTTAGDKIGPGTFSINVTNTFTGCLSPGTINAITTPQQVSILTATELDQTICNPDGQITVTSVSPNTVADFTYLWYRNSPSTAPLQDATPSNITASSLTALNYLTIGAGTYYVTGTKLTNGTGGSGCVTPPFQVVIKDVTINPTVTLTAFTNTACDNNYEGKITVDAKDTGGPGVGKTYAYVWDPLNPVVIANTPSNNGVGNSTPANLKEGTYNVTVTNNFTNCATVSQTTLLQSATPIVVANATPVNQQLCSPDGSITIGPNDVLVNGVPDPVHTDFVFSWHQGSASGPVVGVNADVLNLGNDPTIGAGDYYVTATRDSGVPVGSGCQSAPLRVTIKDVSIKPSVTLAAFTNTACDTNYEGKITVTATDSGGPGVGKLYTYTWDPANPIVIPNTAANDGNPANADGDGDNVASLKEGTYNVTVTNNFTSCATVSQTTLTQSNTPILAIIATTTDQMICNPDGKIKVGNVLVNNAVDPVHTDFTFNWYQNITTSPPIVSGVGVDVLSTANFATMGKGTYFVTVTKNALPPGSGCVSPPLRADVNDVHVNPLIAAATENPNVNCAGGPGAGKITINEATPLNYTYSWFAGDAVTGTPVLTTGGVNGEVALNLAPGDYTVQERSNATNCVSVQSYTIANNPTIVAFDPSGFSSPAVTTCTLATGAPSNGSATISSILENNVSQPLASYTFLWTDASNTVLQNSALATLNNIPPGSYFVTATNTTSNCKANYQFKIADQTIGSTTVALTNFGQPERCITPMTGFLTVQGGGSVAGPYTYQWFTGDQRPSPAGAPLATGATLNNIPIAAGQIFTVKTINSNNCWAVDAYSIPLIVNPIVITASTNPLTYCTSNNGEIFSTIVNDNKFNYNFFWAKGNTVNPPVDYTTNDVTGLPAGNYTVVAVDKTDNGCVSPSVTVTIDNAQIIPVITASVLKPLTICDPARPDGVAAANVGGDIIHYTFDWFAGNSASGTSFFRGADVNGLSNKTYTVLATQTETGCFSTASISVPTNFAVIPAPIVAVLSNVTSCLKDNGQLSATVGGVTKDYIFDWANGTSAPPPIDFTGEIYSNLSVGQYTVIATSRITGCVSAPTTAPIINEQVFPKFDFLIQDASCQSSNGFITLLVADDVSVAQVRWYQNGTLVFDGPNLQDAKAGIYQVTVRTTFGCETTQDVNLPANILPFNGVSRTADGKNDFFLIECIENFPQNHVEIFNRAGTKVFEANGYNNMDVLFDGKSNRGVSIMGTNLPAGTYFYVISKGDGTKQLVGYLELVD